MGKQATFDLHACVEHIASKNLYCSEPIPSGCSDS
jgi:hypothetical protein